MSAASKLFSHHHCSRWTLNIVLKQEDPCSPVEQKPSASPEITPIPALAKKNLHPSSPRVSSTTVPSVLIK